MDNRNDGLWQGGPWEQPSPVFPDPPAVRIPPAALCCAYGGSGGSGPGFWGWPR